MKSIFYGILVAFAIWCGGHEPTLPLWLCVLIICLRGTVKMVNTMDVAIKYLSRYMPMWEVIGVSVTIIYLARTKSWVGTLFRFTLFVIWLCYVLAGVVEIFRRTIKHKEPFLQVVFDTRLDYPGRESYFHLREREVEAELARREGAKSTFKG